LEEAHAWRWDSRFVENPNDSWESERELTYVSSVVYEENRWDPGENCRRGAIEHNRVLVDSGVAIRSDNNKRITPSREYRVHLPREPLAGGTVRATEVDDSFTSTNELLDCQRVGIPNYAERACRQVVTVAREALLERKTLHATTEFVESRSFPPPTVLAKDKRHDQRDRWYEW
jgi:hypothetical protein